MTFFSTSSEIILNKMFKLRPAFCAVASKARYIAHNSTTRPTTLSAASAGGRWQPFSTRDVAEIKEADDDAEAAIAIVKERREELTKKGKHLVWESPEQLPAAPLPEKVEEIAALDPMAEVAKYNRTDGSERIVMIRQDQANVKQSPLHPEKIWRISFVDNGGDATSKWENSLMGWTSNADPYQSEPPLKFSNAMDAVYFAKKCGWKYLVKEPIKRQLRSDGAQYQDNFLPQAVAAKMSKEGKLCKQWERSAAGSSHYFRPLRYHGKGVVPQYGPNPEAETLPPVEAYYKRR